MSNKGFALLELFAVIALLSLVAAIAIPQILMTAKEQKEKMFRLAVNETFNEALNRLNENVELTKEKGSWNCKDFKYDGEYPFTSCVITWNKKNPTLVNLKISVVSNENSKWQYQNKTKSQIEIKPSNYS